MTRCFIALGSNLEQPLTQVNRAVQELAALPDTTLKTASCWYQSAAIGPGDQADYINGVVELYSQLKPLPLLAHLQAIENLHFRKRLQHWGPRTLDLDLLLYGDEIIEHPDLIVPHPRMQNRNFVLYPLSEIDPNLVFPDGNSLKKLLKQCPIKDLRLVENTSSPTIAH